MSDQSRVWPFDDADEHDPLAALRIPVTDPYPRWRYIAAFDGESHVRPTGHESAQLASFIDQYKAYWFTDSYQAELLGRPLDADGGCTTVIFHKWGADDWSYRLDSWERWPFWVPVAPCCRGGEFDYRKVPGPLPLIAVMDRIHSIGEMPSSHWQAWKATHPEIFYTRQETP